MRAGLSENFLSEIVAARREQVAEDRARPLPARPVQKARKLSAALRAGQGVSIIAEFKRASPSLGAIRAEADPAEMAKLYQAGDAAAISVLTEPRYFQGSINDLRAIRAATSLPLLRKDFVVDEYQIEEAAAAGADAILLIVAALTDAELQRFRDLAENDLGLDALVEVHQAEEMKRASGCGARLIGVNNRDLRTFATSLETSIELAALAPPESVLVSESGIATPADIGRLRAAGYRGFLIGESLMRAPDPVELLKSLRHADL